MISFDPGESYESYWIHPDKHLLLRHNLIGLCLSFFLIVINVLIKVNNINLY